MIIIALLCDNYLMVYGGTGVPFGQSSSNKLHVCDLRHLHWQEVETTGDPPLEQYGQVRNTHFEFMICFYKPCISVRVCAVLKGCNLWR